MLHRVEILPLGLDLGVAFQFLVAFGEADALGIGRIGDFDHHQQVHPLATVGFPDPGQAEIQDIVLLDGLQNMPPAQGQQSAAGLLEGLGKAGHGQHETDHLVLLVDHGLEQVLVDEGEILLDEVMDLFFGQGHGAVDLLERLVQQVEQLLGAGQDLFFIGELQHAHAAALLDALGQAQQLFGKSIH